jgi:hypothetical protein
LSSGAKAIISFNRMRIHEVGSYWWAVVPFRSWYDRLLSQGRIVSKANQLKTPIPAPATHRDQFFMVHGFMVKTTPESYESHRESTRRISSARPITVLKSAGAKAAP